MFEVILFIWLCVKPWQVRELEEALRSVWGCWVLSAGQLITTTPLTKIDAERGRSNLVGHIPYLVFRILHFIIIIFFFSIFFSVLLSFAIGLRRRDEVRHEIGFFSLEQMRREVEWSAWKRMMTKAMFWMTKRRWKIVSWDKTGSLTNLAKWWEQYESIMMSPTLLAYIKSICSWTRRDRAKIHPPGWWTYCLPGRLRWSDEVDCLWWGRRDADIEVHLTINRRM